MITYGSTFTGIRGLDLAFERVIGARCLWSAEQSAYCREIIWQHAGRDHRIASDVRDVGGEMPRVDGLTAGFPCQDLSLAGKGAGIENGERSGLWREVARIIDVQRPDIVFLENVRALLPRGFDHVLADLACLGFDAEWTCLRASDVGAPHRRDRIFILAYTNGRGLRLLAERHEQLEAERRNAELVDASTNAGVADSDRAQRSERWTSAGTERHEHAGGSRSLLRSDAARLANTSGRGHAPENARRDAAERRQSEPADGREALADRMHDGRDGLGSRNDDDRRDAPGHVAHRCDAGSLDDHRWPPGPDDAEGWARWIGSGGPSPGLRRSPHGLPAWVHGSRLADGLRRARLRALGNSVVRQQAEEALRRLIWAAVRG